MAHEIPAIGGRTDPSRLFSEADEDQDGSLNATEAQGIADMITKATGEDMAVDDLIAAYDEDGDGALSEQETLAALEANRPEGPFGPETEAGASAGRAWAQASGIENYLMMANLDMDRNPSASLSATAGGGEAVSSRSAISENTLA